jgi:hypothetical protein
VNVADEKQAVNRSWNVGAKGNTKDNSARRFATARRLPDLIRPR